MQAAWDLQVMQPAPYQAAVEPNSRGLTVNLRSRHKADFAISAKQPKSADGGAGPPEASCGEHAPMPGVGEGLAPHPDLCQVPLRLPALR